MPPSQLKRLRVSLREQGVVGPQKSKKQKRHASKNGTLKDSRIQRTAALQGIREQFNPFEVKPVGRSKFEFANASGGKETKSIAGRPGVTKGLGEENVGFPLYWKSSGHPLNIRITATENSTGRDATAQEGGWYHGPKNW